MDSKSPSQGLFPNAHNLQIGTGHHGSALEITRDSTESDNSSTSGNTIDTNVLRNIIDDEHMHDLEDLKERAANSRFYLTDLYAEKGNIPLDRMLDDKSMPDTYLSDPNDFTRYNLRVQKEYELREKIQSLLQKQACGNVKVLKEDMVLESYTADDAVWRHFDGANHKRLVRATSSWLKQRLPKFGKRLVVDEPKDTVSRSSSRTLIIDNASYRNMAINEDVTLNHKRESTRSSNSLESNTSYGARSTSRGLLGNLNNFLNGPHHATYHVQRKLRVRHIQMVGIGACISVGIFLTSGKAFSIAGPFGTLLGFTLTGSVVLATLLSFTELSTLIPVSSGFSGLASRFVEDAFGFALGWTYWFSSMIAMPAQIVACTFYLGYFQTLEISRKIVAGFTTCFLLYPVAINMMDVRVLGEVVYVAGILKILMPIAMIIAMSVLNAGGGRAREKVGFRYWDSSKSQDSLTYGLFRPTFDLGDVGEGSMQGIKGATGRFLAVISVMLISTFAYSGVEMTFVACGEVINPRKSIPSAIKRTFSVVLIIYVLMVLTVGINIYSGDPRLLSYYAGSVKDRFSASLNANVTNWQITARCHERVLKQEGGSKTGLSPWVLALQNFGLCTFASIFNGVMIFFTASAEVSSLLSSSRTLYAMAVQRKAPAIFQRCNKSGVPYVSVLFSSAFGVIAYLAVDPTAVENFNILANIASTSTSIIWMGLNLSFLRFYYALKTRKDIISRDDPSYPYRSPLQPYLSLYGLLGCSIFVLFMGYINFMSDYWNTKSFFSAYGGLMLFAASYIGYKTIGTSKIQRLDQIDMDTGRRETDRMIWKEYKQYSGPYRERAKKLITWLY